MTARPSHVDLRRDLPQKRPNSSESESYSGCEAETDPDAGQSKRPRTAQPADAALPVVAGGHCIAVCTSVAPPPPQELRKAEPLPVPKVLLAQLNQQVEGSALSRVPSNASTNAYYSSGSDSVVCYGSGNDSCGRSWTSDSSEYPVYNPSDQESGDSDESDSDFCMEE
jgi:hypothetical protein